MIDREQLKYVKNILELHNKDVDLSSIYNILTALKEDNALEFYKTLFNYKSNLNIDYLLNVLDATRSYKELSSDIFDSFSDNQIASKNALLSAIDDLDILTKDSTVTIWGCWYGSILIPKIADKVKKVYGMDLDISPLKIASKKLFPEYNNLEFVVGDVFADCKRFYLDTNLIINTSCEHMPPMKEWPWFGPGAIKEDNIPGKDPKISSNCYFAFQSNNMFGIEGHINCVASLQEFEDQLPKRAKVLYREEVEDTRGTRYMLVGKFMPL